MRFITTLFLTACGITALAANETIPQENTLATSTADEIKTAALQSEHKIIFAGEGQQASQDDIRKAISMFYVDQFRHFQDPEAPFFMLMSRDASLGLGIGGSVRMRGWADFDGSIPANGFAPYLIPVPGNPEHRKRLGGTPGGSALFMRIIGRNKQLGNIIGYIQGDFSASNNTFKLKKAYVTISDWTIGYASSTFSDPAAQTPTIDGAGQNGKISRSSMLVRWMHNVRTNWEIAASVEMPSSQIDADGINVKRLDDYLPDVSAFAQYQWEHGQHIRLSGILRGIPYRDLVAQKNRTITGWGIQLSTILYPTTRVAIYGAINTGKGYSSLMGDLSVGNFDLVPENATDGRMYAPLSMGLNIGTKYNFTPNVYACMALGKAAYFPKYQANPTDYRYGLYGALNLFYEPTPRLQVGIEYLVGQRHDFSGQHASANRIDALFQFAF